MNTDLCARTNEQRTDIESGTAFVWWDEAFVEFHHFLGHLHEELCRHFRHEDAAAGALQAGSIVFDAEEADFAIGAAESLLSLEGFLSVVKTGGSHVDVDGVC